jgi:mRNA-degrading endonuclease toxin of MazEF toxin-antitoxin module
VRSCLILIERPSRDESDRAGLALSSVLWPATAARPPGAKITGVVLADHGKNLDWQARRVVFEAKAPVDVVTDVRERLRVLLGL